MKYYIFPNNSIYFFKERYKITYDRQHFKKFYWFLLIFERKIDLKRIFFFREKLKIEKLIHWPFISYQHEYKLEFSFITILNEKVVKMTASWNIMNSFQCIKQ